MPHWEVLWTEGRDGNIRHVAEHGVTVREVEQVLKQPIVIEQSRSSNRFIAFGYTTRRRRLAVVYEMVDDVTVYPVTAYDVED